jgi:hypothetical protein
MGDVEMTEQGCVTWLVFFLCMRVTAREERARRVVGAWTSGDGVRRALAVEFCILRFLDLLNTMEVSVFVNSH